MKTQKKNKMVLVRWQGNGSSDYDGKEHWVQKNSLVNQDKKVGEAVIIKWFSEKWNGVLIKDVKEKVKRKESTGIPKVKNGLKQKKKEKGKILCIGNSREQRTNLLQASSASRITRKSTKLTCKSQTSPTRKSPTIKTPSKLKELSPSAQYSSTSGLWSPVPKGPKGQTSLGPLQTRKSPTIKTPTIKTPSKLKELSPSAQYTSTSGLWSPVPKGPKGQTSLGPLQTRKSPTIKTPTIKTPSKLKELSPSAQYTSTSGLWSPVPKGQTSLGPLQTRKTPSKLKELSPSAQYTSTSGLWSPVSKGQTSLGPLQTRKSPTIKSPTIKTPSKLKELSPSAQYRSVTKIWSPIECTSQNSKHQSIHLVCRNFPPRDQYTFADDKAVPTSSNHSSTSGLWSPVPKVPKGQTSLGPLQTRKTPSKLKELSPSAQYTSTSGLWSPVPKRPKGQTSLGPLQTRKSPTIKMPTLKTPSKLKELSPSAQYTYGHSGIKTESQLSTSIRLYGQAQKCIYGSPYTACTVPSPQTSPMTKKEFEVYQLPMTKLFKDSGEGQKFQFGSMYEPPPQASSEKKIGQNQPIPKQLFQDLGEDSRQKSQGKMAIRIRETLQQRNWSLIPKLKGAPALARELLKKMVPEEELCKASIAGKNKDGNKLDEVQMEMIKETVCDVYTCDSHTERKCLWKMCKTSLVQMLKHTRTKGCKNTVVPKMF